MQDPRMQPILVDDDRHENESDGLSRGWYHDTDDPHEPDDEDFPDEPDHPRM